MTSRWRDLPTSDRRLYAVTVVCVLVVAGVGLALGMIVGGR